ncbi:hypothetical protein D5396_21715 [Rahnella inusitata]|uniref:Uncharacterized protein n=1 Tax=Rahnella inusitata TaxID=58169 RepID=A0ABX9NVM2_9GAMM|nr:hypothetical protein D5396_21715 [Rahnella inusitata]
MVIYSEFRKVMQSTRIPTGKQISHFANPDADKAEMRVHIKLPLLPLRYNNSLTNNKNITLWDSACMSSGFTKPSIPKVFRGCIKPDFMMIVEECSANL